MLCFGKMGDNLVESWKKQIQWHSDNNQFSALNRIDGRPMEFGVGDFHRVHYSGNPQWDLTGDGSITVWARELHRQDHLHVNVQRHCMGCRRKWWGNNSKTIKEDAERFPRGHWSFLGPGSEKKRYGTSECEPDGSWDRTAEKMQQNFAGSGHPIFRCTSALERKGLKSKGGGKTSVHFNCSTQNIELLLQRVISVNQLTLYGAVADMIEELPVGRRAPGKPNKFLHNLLSQKCKPMKSDRGICCKNTTNDLRNYQRPEVIQTMLRSRFEISCSSVTKWKSKSLFLPRRFVASRSKRNSYKRMDSKQCTSWPSLGHKKFAINTADTVLKFKFNLCSKIIPYLGLQMWTVLTNSSEKPCRSGRSERKRKLRGNPLRMRDQD